MVAPPIGSFDHVIVYCSDNQSHIIFNTSSVSTLPIKTVFCSIVPNMALMSFVLETVKQGFDSAINHIIQEGH